MEFTASKRYYLNKVPVFHAGVWMFIVVGSTTIGPAGKFYRISNCIKSYYCKDRWGIVITAMNISLLALETIKFFIRNPSQFSGLILTILVPFWLIIRIT